MLSPKRYPWDVILPILFAIAVVVITTWSYMQ
jgi:hypothetical protein